MKKYRLKPLMLIATTSVGCANQGNPLIEFKQALTFDRDNPFVAQIGALLGLPESDINDRFKEAAKR